MKNVYKVNEDAVKKIAERVYDNGSTVINRNDLEEMFPELRESEGEKIRNFLVDFIKACGWSEKQFPPREQCIAWLENNAWSEEDSIMYNRLLSFAESEFGCEYDLVKWLKSLRDRRYE